MKKRNLYLLFLLFIRHLSPVFTAQEEPVYQTPEEIRLQMDSISSLVFPETLPTRSIHEKTLDKVYGPQGLNLDPEILKHIKQTYCYLEFLLKVNTVKSSINKAQYQQDFKAFLTPPADGIPMRPTQELVESPSWNNIVITGEDIKNSPAWQSFVKAMTCDCIDNKPNFIMGSIAAHAQLAMFLPNIEMAYATTEFADVRLYTESLVTQDTMQTEQYKNYIAQTTDWKNIGPGKIDGAMTSFKKSDFYIYTHTPPNANSAGNNPTLAISLEVKELIIAYYMLINIQQTIFDSMTPDNLQAILTKAASRELQPNFFLYTPSDLAYIYDYLTVKQIIENNKANPQKSAITMNETPADGSMVRSSIETIKKIEQAQTQGQQGAENKSMAEIIFTPELPTTSIFQAQLEQIYAAQGLQIPAEQLSNIKKTYCYLEFLVKLDKIKNQPQFAAYKNDFNTFLNIPADQPNFPTQALVTSLGWKSIAVTQDEITASAAWQSFIKAMICKYDQDTKDFIVDSGDTSSVMIGYTSNIEAAYTTQEFTNMRFYTETIQVQQALQKELGQRYLSQCPDWKNLNKEQLAAAMTQFRATDFYKQTHPDEDTQPQEDQKAPQLSLQTVEQIRSYFMIITIQKNLYEIIKPDNIQPMLMQASSTKISPNFFPYQPSDLAYLYDAITLTNIIQNTNEQPITSTFDSLFSEEYEIEESSDEVTIQKVKNPFKKSNKIIKDGFTKEITKPTQEKFEKPIKEKIIKPSDRGFNRVVLPVYISAIKEVNTQIGIIVEAQVNQFIAMSGDITYGFSMMSGNEKLAKRQRARVVKKLKENKGLIMTIFGAAIIYTLAPVIMAFPGGAGIFIAYAAGSMMYDKRASEPVMKVMMLVMMPIMQGMEFLTQNMTTGFIEMSALLTYATYYYAQGYLNNSPDALLLKVIAPDVWKKWNDDVAHPARAAAMVRADLEKYRQTINIIMGVVLTIVITIIIMVLTAGAGAAYQSMAMAGYFGQTAMMSATATAASNAAAQAAAAQAAAAVAREAAKQAAMEAAKQGATAASKQLAQRLAQEALKATAKAALKQAASSQAAALLATRQAAITGAKQVTQATGKQAFTAVAQQAAAKGAAQQAAAQAAAKQALAQQAQAIVANQTDDALALATRLALQQGDDAVRVGVQQSDDLARLTLQQADGIARTSVQQSSDDAALAAAKESQKEAVKAVQRIVQAEKDRIASMFAYQQGQAFGWGKAVKIAFWDPGFIFGNLMNIGMSAFGIIAAIAADKAALNMLDEERESIQSLWKFVEDNKVNIVHAQKDFGNELHKKHLAAVENNALGLQYYNNFLNGSVNNVQKQIAQVLTQQQIQMLTPDSNGLKIADIGATWGLQTPFVYLYPSQGFITTTLGRPDFPYAQEVAQAPLTADKNEVAKTPTDSLTLTKEDTTQSEKLWFNQRAVATLPQSADTPLNVEIRFRFIYNLNASYHVGLYLGGTYHDYNSPAYLKSLNNGDLADLNAAHLAKMLVIKRAPQEKSPSVVLYEHEGKGWLAKNPINTNILNNASIYHMSANLNKDKLTVSFWSEDNPSDKWTTTTTVTPCDQRTFGVIFSGAAVQWGVVEPTLKIVENKKARPASNRKSEIERTQASKAAWKKLLAPSFGLMKLESLGRGALLQGQYLYTTESTKLTDAQGNPTKDYVVYASAAAGNVTNIGNTPYPAQGSQDVPPNVIISMITGNVYDQTGKIISQVNNPWATYTQKKNNFSQAIHQAIAQTTQLYQKQLQEFTFGSHKLTSASTEALNKGLFIYTTSTTLKDRQGNPIVDYLVMADLINGSLGSRIGMRPSNSVEGMVSLISGDVYTRASAKPFDGGYSQLSQYTRQYGQLPQALAAQIAISTSAYKSTQQAQVTPPTKTVEVSGIGSQTISLADLLNAPAPQNGGAQIGLSTAAPSKIISTTQTISQLQSSAAGDATFEFGGTVGLAGFDMSSGFAAARPAKNTTPISSPPVQKNSPTSQNSIPQQSSPASPSPTAQQISQPVQQSAPSVTQISNDQFSLAGSSGFSFGGGTGFSTAAPKTTIPTPAAPVTQPKAPVTSHSSNQQHPVYTQPSPTPQQVTKPAVVNNIQEEFGLVGSSGFSF